MHYFKRNWNEPRGDGHDDWGTSVWYFETDQRLCVIKQIEVYVNGTILHYDREHMDDVYGGLAEKSLDADDFAQFAIEQAEFEQIWSSQRPFNR